MYRRAGGREGIGPGTVGRDLLQEEESFIEAYLMELEAEKEVELEEDNEVFENSETEDKSETDVEPEPEDKSEADVEPESEEDLEEIREPELEEESKDLNLLPARGTCRRKPLRNCYREEKGVQRNSWRKEKCKWRLS